MKDFTYLLDLFFAFLTSLLKGFDHFINYVNYVMSPEVRVGFVDNIDPAFKHGVAFFNTAQGVERKPFTVDRPENLDEPPITTVRSIFDQIKRMGYHATEIEITTARELRIYRNGDNAPLLVQLI